MKFQIILGIAFCAALALCGCSEMPMRMPGKESTETPLKTVSIPQHMPEATKQSSEYSPKNEPVPGKCVPRTTVEPPYIKAPEMPNPSQDTRPSEPRPTPGATTDTQDTSLTAQCDLQHIVHPEKTSELSYITKPEPPDFLCITAPESVNPPYITAPQAPTLTSDSSPDQGTTISMPTAQPAESKPMLTPNGLQPLAPTATLEPTPIPEPESTSAPTIEGGYAICSCGAVIKPDALVQHMKQHARDGDSHSYTAY